MSLTADEDLRYYIETADNYAKFRKVIEEHGGEHARAYRLASRMSLRRFAASLGVSPSWWSKVERGLEVLPVEVARKLIEGSGE